MRILITGARSGIGKAIAEKFKSEGWEIDTIEKDEGVQNLYSWDKKKEQVKTSGEFHAMVLNAGVLFFDLEGEWANAWELIQTNLMGVYYGLYLAPKLLAKGSPICVISSNAAYTADIFSPLYHASKAAVSSLSHSFALIYAPEFRIFSVSPGLVRTNLGGSGGNLPVSMVEKIPVKRELYPEELAMYIYLLMTKFHYVVGEDIVIDGGSRWVR